jgi:hypothetical protein
MGQTGTVAAARMMPAPSMRTNPPPRMPPLCRALVDAPGITRQVMNFKRLALTDFTIDIPRLASKKVLTAKCTETGA